MFLIQQETLFDADPPLQGPDGVNVTMRNRSPEVDKTIQFLSFMSVKSLSDVISNN